MKAMIFAAGLGSRLKDYTANRPKALVEINGRPLIDHVIVKLIKQGCEEFIVNIHHYGDQIIDFLKTNKFYNKRIEISDEREELLDTGGGLLNARWFFDDKKDFLVHNVDIITDINIAELFDYHNKYGALVTLAVRKRTTSRYFLFDEKMNLNGWVNKKTNEEIIVGENKQLLSEYAFSGVQIVNPKIFDLISERGKFGLTPLYIRLCENNIINGFVHNNGFWADAGKPDDLVGIAKAMNNKKL